MTMAPTLLRQFRKLLQQPQGESCRSLDWEKDTGSVRQLTKTAIFKATEKHI